MMTGLALTILLTCGPAAVAAEPKAQPPKAAAVSAAAQPSKTPAVSPRPQVLKIAPASIRPQRSFRVEGDLSGMTSETTDQLYTRISFTKTAANRKWYLRTGYTAIKSRSYSKGNVYETDVNTYSLDTQYRADRDGSYRFVSATANIRQRPDATWGRVGTSGFRMLSAGVGRQIAPGLDAEIALAGVTTYDERTESIVTPVYTLRMRTGLSSSLVLDGQAYFVQPFEDSALVDSRVNLTYKFTPTVGIRLSYVANNFIKPVTLNSEWDKSLRVSLVFGRPN